MSLCRNANEDLPVTQRKSIYIIVWLVLSTILTYVYSLLVQGYLWMQNASSAFEFDSISYTAGFELAPWKTMPKAFGSWISLLFVAVILSMTGLFVLRIYAQYMNKGYVDKDRNFRYSEDGSYGTSGWADIREIIKDEIAIVNGYRSTKGYILGQMSPNGDKLISINPNKKKGNNHIATFGASGAGKSAMLVKNYIIQAAKKKESIIVTDPKGELCEDTAEYLRNNGYVVKIFNLVDPKHGDSWNCLSEIKNDELRAQVFADTIIQNTSSGKGGGDPFWDTSEMNLLKALILRVHLGSDFKEEDKNMGTVYNLLIKATGEAALDALFDIRRMPRTEDGGLPPEAKSIAPYNIFKQAPDNTRGGIILGLGTRLQIFQNDIICKITKFDDIDLTLPGRKPCAYFCIMSDQDSTLNFLSSLFFSFLFIDLVRYADNNGGKCDVPVNFLLDEFPNIGKISDFEKKISTVRSRGLNILVIFQAISQLQNRYPNGVWSEILANCDTHLFLGCNDPDTAKFISDRAGDITIKVNSIRQQRTSRLSPIYRSGVAENFGEGRRKLLTPDEVLRMPNDKCLIIFRGHKVLQAYKYPYWNNPESKKFIKKKIVDYRTIETVTKKDVEEQRKKDFAGLDGYPLISDIPVEDVKNKKEYNTTPENTSSDCLDDFIPSLDDIDLKISEYIAEESKEEIRKLEPKTTPLSTSIENQGLVQAWSMEKKNTEKSIKDPYENTTEIDDSVFSFQTKPKNRASSGKTTKDISAIGKRTS